MSNNLDEQDNLLEQIQELKHTQEKMMSRVRQLITSLPFGLILVQKNHRIKALNKIAAQYFQYSDSELQKQKINVLFPEIDRLEVTKQSMRLMGRKKSGEHFATEVTVNELEMGGEELLFVSVQDITERQLLEQLRQDLMSMVSHDLRGPLTSVRIMLELVAEGTYGNLTERGRELVSQSVSLVEYLNSLVSNLLDSEKAASGAIELHIAETTIGSIVEQAINSVQVPEGFSPIPIETSVTNDEIAVDRDRIVQVLINLISNAIKYSPKDSKITIIAGIEGVYAKFQVIDQGPGIPADLQPIIFERYRQLNQPSETKRKGFGLGLAICKALVEKHNGRLWVESEPTKGSKFCFTVPIGPE